MRNGKSQSRLRSWVLHYEAFTDPLQATANRSLRAALSRHHTTLSQSPSKHDWRFEILRSSRASRLASLKTYLRNMSPSAGWYT